MNVSNLVVARAGALFLVAAVGLAMGCRSRSGGVNIWKAVADNDQAAIDTFAESGGDVNVRNMRGETPLWVALTDNKREAYESLLRNGADPNVVMRGKRVVTHWAAIKKDTWWLKLALEHGADPNLINVGRGRPSEGSPLKFAISNGSLDHVRLLVDAGADIDKPDPYGNYPLASAIAQGKFDIVYYLLEKGADFRAARSSGVSFLTYVSEKYTHRREWYLLKEDREGIAKIHDWLTAKGVDVPPDKG